MEATLVAEKDITKTQLVKGRFLNLFELTDQGKKHLHFERPFKPGQERLSSGCDIVALGVDPKSNRLKIILEIIYRVPIAKYVIQVPAGMRDEHERDLVGSALRELKEETGYIGTAPISDTILRLKPILESPILYNDPWKSNETTNLITLEVDFSLPENVNPQPHLEDDEDIEVIILDLLDLQKELEEIQRVRGVEVDNRVHMLAMGLQLAAHL
ncbi:hypothetical protein FGO68_gene16616 [Halteria grandinella]|uniref:Nudix hydrolase domain-containing protein n=1 Tax=Halteria grandinella TaxID=5974 RepID=A0A8J8NJ58_HALGN|nr:hypothetical protein FGO68_gene16616 [Halteria grandinella]